MKVSFQMGVREVSGGRLGRLWMALNVLEQDFKGPAASDRKPVELLENRSDVIEG